MSYIDYIIIGILFVSALIGMYNGFVVSALGVLSSFFSWLTSLILHPLLSKSLMRQYPDLIQRIIYYTEGASKIKSVEERGMPVSSLTKEQIINMIDRAQLPPPFDQLLLSNMLNGSLNHLTTVGEYFDHTVAYIILNLICFLFLFIGIRIICQIIITLANEIIGLPVLKRCDSLAGAGIGLIGGMIFVFILFSLIPVLLTLVPLDIIYSLIENSLLGKFFFKSNIFTNFIKGFV